MFKVSFHYVSGAVSTSKCHSEYAAKWLAETFSKVGYVEYVTITKVREE